MKHFLTQFKRYIAAIVEMIRIELGSSFFKKALQRYPDYYNELDTIPGTFMYATPSDPFLTELRETYKLQQVAGDGDEISKIFNLLRWVHQTLRWDGMSQYPGPYNAIDIIKVCREQRMGVNCRMLATVLNEVYLSLGFYSRHVTCMPQEESFFDCHVINMVYHSGMGKWLYVDPSFGAYFQDTCGRYLSIQEVRESLINNGTPVVNDEMNCNGKQYWGRKRRYISYMTKNLFRFSCPMQSEYNYESADKARMYLYLNPKGHRRDMNPKTLTNPRGIQITRFYTSDPSIFWASPMRSNA